MNTSTAQHIQEPRRTGGANQIIVYDEHGNAICNCTMFHGKHEREAASVNARRIVAHGSGRRVLLPSAGPRAQFGRTGPKGPIPAPAAPGPPRGRPVNHPQRRVEMGWTIFPHMPQEQLIEKLIASKSHEVNEGICRRQTQAYSLACEQGTEILWAVQRTSLNSKPFETHIACFLIEGSGYKWLSECEHPYYYSCPPEYLDLAPQACPEWRAKVRRYHAIQQAEVSA
ncbi:MAG: hypothetical protein LBF16_01270 [Pseudomonadales bacterium]|nr:hypothetical protein [Pseudomonadales bacterium]